MQAASAGQAACWNLHFFDTRYDKILSFIEIRSPFPETTKMAYAGTEQTLWYFFGIAGVLLFLITVVMVYLVIRKRRSRALIASGISNNYILEIFWIILPTFIALSTLAIGWSSHSGLRTVPDDEPNFKVIVGQDAWSSGDGNQKKTENEPEVPEGRAIHLLISLLDVQHGFFLPGFRMHAGAIKKSRRMPGFRPMKPENLLSGAMEIAE